MSDVPKTSLRIRGIYATALTRLLLDMGYGITQPSREIQERFQIPETDTAPDISISDREDRQGIRISGRGALVDSLVQALWEALLDMVARRKPASGRTNGSAGDLITYDVEFPGASKAVLDGQRARVVPTLENHHRLRLIASDYLDLIEGQIERTPHRQKTLEREFLERFVYQPLRKSGLVRFEHVKPEGEVLSLREGEVLSLDRGRLTIRREFRHGRYDGLDLDIEPGDYGVSEVRPGAWYLKHRYFTRRGEFKGEYININTPIELYPDRIRYVDLHIDVVRRAGERPRIIDHGQLEAVARKRFISPGLEQKAKELSRRLLEKIMETNA